MPDRTAWIKFVIFIIVLRYSLFWKYWSKTEIFTSLSHFTLSKNHYIIRRKLIFITLGTYRVKNARFTDSHKHTFLWQPNMMLALLPVPDFWGWEFACRYKKSRHKIPHGKCMHTVFTHEMLKYQKSNEWDFWYKNNECVNTIQSTFHVLMCLL